MTTFRKDFRICGILLSICGFANTNVALQVSIRALIAALNNSTPNLNNAICAYGIYLALAFTGVLYIILGNPILTFTAHNGDFSKHYISMVLVATTFVLSLVMTPFGIWVLVDMTDGSWQAMGGAACGLAIIASGVLLYLIICLHKEMGPCCGGCGRNQKCGQASNGGCESVEIGNNSGTTTSPPAYKY